MLALWVYVNFAIISSSKHCSISPRPHFTSKNRHRTPPISLAFIRDKTYHGAVCGFLIACSFLKHLMVYLFKVISAQRCFVSKGAVYKVKDVMECFGLICEMCICWCATQQYTCTCTCKATGLLPHFVDCSLSISLSLCQTELVLQNTRGLEQLLQEKSVRMTRISLNLISNLSSKLLNPQKNLSKYHGQVNNCQLSTIEYYRKILWSVVWMNCNVLFSTASKSASGWQSEKHRTVQSRFGVYIQKINSPQKKISQLWRREGRKRSLGLQFTCWLTPAHSWNVKAMWKWENGKAFIG